MTISGGLPIRHLTPVTLAAIVAELSEVEDAGGLELSECIALDRVRARLVATVGEEEAARLVFVAEGAPA